ncbi:biotin transporter BioY [Anaerolentibacter hominis]|uniref:biotin transporter BioY n=1 Tax=Anaerolentibacter hominis TaxID=3079009 RepID=UPI0031B81760
MRNQRSRKIVFIGMFAGLMAVFSQISFPVPFSTVPFSLGVFGAFLSGVMLSPSSAVQAQAVYLLLGAVGLPVFSQFTGGLSILAGPTGGFLAGYVLLAFFSSFVSRRMKKYQIIGEFAGMLLGLALCYICGMLWFSKIMNVPVMSAFVLSVMPFIPFDLVKLVLAWYVGKILKTAFEKSGLRMP